MPDEHTHPRLSSWSLFMCLNRDMTVSLSAFRGRLGNGLTR